MTGSETIREYESSFAGWLGAGRAFSFWKGRVALYAILKALGITEGDEVILPGYTCVMNVNPIKYLGAKPVYVDIEPATYNINAHLLPKKITPKAKVIIAQHTYGYPCDMDAIMNVADKNDIPVVEDCCLSLGSKYKGKTCGTMGLAAYFSFQWNKPYTTGLGGMAVTSDSALADKIEQLRASEMCLPAANEVTMLWAQLAVYRSVVYPRTTAFAQAIFRYLTSKGAVVGSSSASEFQPTMGPDFFKGISSTQAHSGLRQLKKIQQNIAHRIKRAEFYDQLFQQRGWLARAYDGTTIQPVMVRYPVRVNQKQEALAEAAKAGVELGSWFECPLHPHETPLAAYDYQVGMCPEAEKAANEAVNLPLHLRVNEKTLKRSVEFITKFTQAR